MDLLHRRGTRGGPGPGAGAKGDVGRGREKCYPGYREVLPKTVADNNGLTDKGKMRHFISLELLAFFPPFSPSSLSAFLSVVPQWSICFICIKQYLYYQAWFDFLSWVFMAKFADLMSLYILYDRHVFHVDKKKKKTKRILLDLSRLDD